MKKVLLSILILILTTGCVVIKDASIDTIIETTIKSKYSLYNHVNRGYKYYLPRELKAIKKDEYNEVIKSKYHDYYLYVDLVSYYNKVEEEFKVDENIYYSKVLNDGKNKGIINITLNSDDDYIITAKFNYAKIEVKANKNDINDVITNCLVMLSSIQYNDAVIKNLLSNDILSSPEEPVKVFDKETEESDFLDDKEEVYKGNEEEDYDPDVIN